MTLPEQDLVPIVRAPFPLLEFSHAVADELERCGGLFAFERMCFVSERPQHLHPPRLTAAADPGREVRVVWRDGFVCQRAMDEFDVF